jgi:outer membrane protein TolC
MRDLPRRAGRVAALVALGGLVPAGSVGGQSVTLEDAVDAALRGHPAVAAAEARVTAAGEAGDAARAARLPGAAVSATLTRFEEPMIVAPFHSLDLSSPPSFDRTLVQGRLGMQYTLFDGGARSARIRAADAAHDATGFARDGTAMEILESTIAAYVGVLSARALLEASTAQLEALEEEHARASRALAAGTTAELEVLRAAATLQEARAEEASARARVGLAERALARLMGTDAEAISGRPLLDVGVRATPPRGHAASSPLVMSASRAVAAAEARVAEERGGRLPTLEAGAGLLDYGTISGGHVFEWQAGLQVSWPLFTGGARNAAVRRAAADLAAAESDLEATRLRVAQAIDAAETSVVEADTRAEALELAVVQWEEVARIEALALAAGSGVQRDLLRAQAGLFQARAGHAAARYDAIVARARLARADGTLDRTWLNESLETR